MPIYPRYEGSTGVATADTPLEPNKTGKDTMRRAGEALVGAGVAGMSVTQKLQKLKDEADASKAYMQAVREQENEIETYKGDNAKDAKAKFGKFVDGRRGEWFQGLSKEAAYKLEHDLFAKTLENESFSHKVQHRYDVGEYGKTGVDIELQFQRDINRGHVQGDPAKSEWYTRFEKHMDDGVAMGLYEAKPAEEQKLRVLKNASYDMGYRMAVDAPDTFLKVYDEYGNGTDASERSMWMKNIDSKELSQLKGQAEERIRVQKNQKHTEGEWVRQEQDRKDGEIRERVEQHMGKLAVKGQLPESMVDLYDSLRLTTGEKSLFWRKIAQEGALTGGPGDPEVRRSLGLEVANANAGLTSNGDLQRVKAKVEAAVSAKKMPLEEGLKYINALNETTKGENTQIRRDTSTAKAILLKGLTVSGQFNKPTGDEIAAQTDGLLALAKNERSANPRDPIELVQEILPSLRSRAEPSASMNVSEGRRSFGLGPSPKDGAPDLVLDKKASELNEKIQQATPGSADWLRLREEAKRLKRLELQEKAREEMRKNREESKRIRQEQRERQTGAAPPAPMPKEQ